MRKGWGRDPSRVEERVVTVAGSTDWSSDEISAQLPENSGFIQFGIVLTGSGRVSLRNPELRRADA